MMVMVWWVHTTKFKSMQRFVEVIIIIVIIVGNVNLTQASEAALYEVGTNLNTEFPQTIKCTNKEPWCPTCTDQLEDTEPVFYVCSKFQEERARLERVLLGDETNSREYGACDALGCPNVGRCNRVFSHNNQKIENDGPP